MEMSLVNFIPPQPSPLRKWEGVGVLTNDTKVGALAPKKIEQVLKLWLKRACFSN